MTDDATEKKQPKATRRRSPNHPSLDLEDAIRRTKILYDTYGQREIVIPLACEKIGYTNHKSSKAGGAIAAMLAYGLVSSEGRGEKRKVAVTDTGERIVRNAPNRKKLVQEAVLKPKIHRELYNDFVDGAAIAHDDVISQYLLWDRKDGTFNEDTAKPFIKHFRKSLVYAGLARGEESQAENDLDTSNNGTGPEGSHEEDGEIKVGSLVQWISNGQYQFAEPRAVSRIETHTDGSKYAFIEEEGGYAPMSELSIVDPVADEVKELPLLKPNQNPPKRDLPKIENRKGMKTDKLELGDSQLVLQRPIKLTQAAYEDLETMFELLLRNAKRAIESSEAE